jgi:UDP-galactopyranose mutase
MSEPLLPPSPALLVFSHLRWGFVYQRPQHLLSRLAKRWRVTFVEEPVFSDGPARIESHNPCPGVTVLVPHTPVAAAGFHDDQLPVLASLLGHWLQDHPLRDPVVWLYTPMALPLAAPLQPRCIVYDCMDELSAFKDAPRQLRQRESALLKRAAVVFTGGPSLFDSKQGLHPNVHCIPSSVDVAHFAPQGLLADSPEAQQAQALQGELPQPRLGFFGVIDERLDLRLIAELAERRPHWQVVMVGPVLKIDPQALPRQPNIHWLGMQPYAVLPHLLAGWDLCIVPFARNEATRYISPTKTLEYMAGEKPVVSTPIKDVVTLYGHAVALADGSEAFVTACEEVLEESAQARCRRAMEMLTTVSRHSWDRSADSVHRLIVEALERSHALRVEPVGVALPTGADGSAEAAAAPIAATAGQRG